MVQYETAKGFVICVLRANRTIPTSKSTARLRCGKLLFYRRHPSRIQAHLKLCHTQKANCQLCIITIYFTAFIWEWEKNSGFSFVTVGGFGTATYCGPKVWVSFGFLRGVVPCKPCSSPLPKNHKRTSQLEPELSDCHLAQGWLDDKLDAVCRGSVYFGKLRWSWSYASGCWSGSCCDQYLLSAYLQFRSLDWTSTCKVGCSAWATFSSEVCLSSQWCSQEGSQTLAHHAKSACTTPHIFRDVVGSRQRPMPKSLMSQCPGSRLSRHVHTNTCEERVVDRHMMAVYAEHVQCGYLIRAKGS